VTEYDSLSVSTIHVVSPGNDMEECFGNFGHEFIGHPEHSQSITKFWHSRGLG
jgi:hypothetical protein